MQDYSGFPGRGAEDRQEGVEDPEGKGKAKREELDAGDRMSNPPTGKFCFAQMMS